MDAATRSKPYLVYFKVGVLVCGDSRLARLNSLHYKTNHHRNCESHATTAKLKREHVQDGISLLNNSLELNVIR